MTPCPAVPSDPTCSNRGVCVAPDTCACDEGWTGVADLTLGSPSCSVNIVTVQVLWALEAAATLGFQLPVAASSAWIRWSARRSDVKVHALAALNGALLGVSGALRAARPLETVGNDAVVTAVYFCAWTTACLWGQLTFPRFLDLNLRLLGISRTLKREIRLFKLFFPVIIFMVWASSPLLFAIMLGVSDATARYWLTTAFWVGNGIACFVLFVYIARLALDPLMREIQHSASPTVVSAPDVTVASVASSSAAHAVNDSPATGAGLQSTLRKARALRFVLVTQGVSLLVAGFVFGFVPVLNRAAAPYHQPLIMMT